MVDCSVCESATSSRSADLEDEELSEVGHGGVDYRPSTMYTH